MPEFDEEAVWDQVIIQSIDLSDDEAGSWIVGMEFKREYDRDHARVRAFAVNEETGEDFFLEAPASTRKGWDRSEDYLMERLPDEVAESMENIAMAAAVGHLVGMGRDDEALKAADDPALWADTHGVDPEDMEYDDEPFLQSGVMDLDEPTVKEAPKLTEMEVELAIARGNPDEELHELVMADLKGQADAHFAKGNRAEGSAALDRMIDYQARAVRDVTERRDHGSEEAAGFRSKEDGRRQGGNGGQSQQQR